MRDTSITEFPAPNKRTIDDRAGSRLVPSSICTERRPEKSGRRMYLFVASNHCFAPTQL